MGGKSGGGGTQTTVQKADPWEASQPYLKDIMGKAQGAYNAHGNDQYYPGATYVPASPETQAGLDMIEDRANAGSPLTQAGAGLLQSTINGDYLDPTKNPAYQSVMNDVRDRVNSEVGLAGRTGSGAHQGLLTDNLMNAANNLYSQERTNQLNATQLAPTYAANDYNDAQQLMNVGASKEGYSQTQLQDAINRYNFNQNVDWTNLNNYNSLLQGFGGLGSSASGTQAMSGAKSNPIAGGLGGAAVGATIASQLGASSQNGWLATGLGGLLGLFS